MAINRKLAEDCGLDEHEILEIEELHEDLDALISKWIKEPYSEDRAEDMEMNCFGRCYEHLLVVTLEV